MWEAKGRALSSHEIRRQCGGFANSNQGGYLILGATQTGVGWSVEGLKFPDGEPHRYVTSCLQEGVRPIPHYDVRAFDASGGRHLAIVEVQPLAAGPCIIRGTVYERVAGATIPVKNPSRLAELFKRGEQAHARARAAAQRLTKAAVAEFATLEGVDVELDDAEPAPSLFVVVSVAPVTPAADIVTRLFRDSSRRHMHELVERHTATPHPLRPRIWSSVTQSRRVTIAQAQFPGEPDWVVAASWDGGVAMAMRGEARSGRPDWVVSGVVVPAFEAATSVVTMLGGELHGYVDVRIVDPQDDRWSGGARIHRGPIAFTSAALDAAQLSRELSRATGVDVPEPEPTPE